MRVAFIGLGGRASGVVNDTRSVSGMKVVAARDYLGGRVIIDARKRQIGGKVAFIAGPSGAGIALQTWPLDLEETD